MGNLKTKSKSMDNYINPESQRIEIPFRVSLVNMYRFETPIWKQTDEYTILKGLHIRTKKSIVIKKMVINDRTRLIMHSELHVLITVDHTNILKIYDYFQTASHFYIM